MRLGSGIGLMLVGLGLCFVAVRDTYTKSDKKSLYPITPADPFAPFQTLTTAFQAAASGGSDAGAAPTADLTAGPQLADNSSSGEIH